MKRHTKIALLGGGGRTGKYLIQQLSQAGYPMKLLLRHPENFSTEHALIKIMKGDALDPAIIEKLLEDTDVVISTIGQRPGEVLVAEQATKLVLQAMEKHGIKRYILLGGVNIDTPSDRKGPETQQATDWMKAHFPLIQEDRQKAYDCLVASTVDWTLVRVPFITFRDVQNELKVDLEDCRGTQISAESIAAFIVEQMEDATYSRASPFIAE